MMIKTIPNRLLAVIVILVIAGCSREEAYRVTGQLSDPNRKVPVSGAQVSIWTQKIVSGVYAANYILVGESVTGPDGRFAFELENATYTGVRLVFSGPGYFGWETQINTAELSKDVPNDQVYEMLPKAWIRIHVKNSQPHDDDDFFEYRLLNAFTGCEECCSVQSRQYSGMLVDQIIDCMTAGHQELSIHWSKRKNDQQDVKTETYFVAASDTTQIDLFY